MGPVLVVVFAPECELLPRVSKAEEHLHVQALVAQLPVERFDVAVFDWPSWPDEVQMHTIRVGPESIARLADSVPMSTVIESDLFAAQRAACRSPNCVGMQR
jgi:hypothetical protein